MAIFLQIIIKPYQVSETLANVDIDSEYSAFPAENKDLFKTGLTTLVPIIGGGNRLGTLLLSRLDKAFDDVTYY